MAVIYFHSRDFENIGVLFEAKGMQNKVLINFKLTV